MIVVLTGLMGRVLPKGFIPPEDLGYMYLNVQLPAAASLQRTAAVCDEIDEILAATPGVKYYTGVVGFSLLSTVFTTYNAFYFITLDPWAERGAQGPRRCASCCPIVRERLAAHHRRRGVPVPAADHSRRRDRRAASRSCSRTAPARTSSSSPRTRAAFMEAARKRPEFMALMTTLLPERPPGATPTSTATRC